MEHGLEWKKCIGIYTDGAPNMTGHRAGVVAKVKNVSHSGILSTHCSIHREHLVAKKCLQELHEVLPDVIKIRFDTKRSILEYLKPSAKKWVPRILTFFFRLR